MNHAPKTFDIQDLHGDLRVTTYDTKDVLPQCSDLSESERLVTKCCAPYDASAKHDAQGISSGTTCFNPIPVSYWHEKVLRRPAPHCRR